MTEKKPLHKPPSRASDYVNMIDAEPPPPITSYIIPWHCGPGVNMIEACSGVGKMGSAKLTDSDPTTRTAGIKVTCSDCHTTLAQLIHY